MMRLLNVLLLAALTLPMAALDLGDSIPWVSSKEVMPYATFTEKEMHLESYRGAPMFLAIWRDHGGLKKGFQERIFKVEQEFAKQGLLVVSIANNKAVAEKFFEKVPQRSVILFVDDETLEQFQPITNNMRFLMIDGHGKVVSAQNENMLAKGIPRAFEQTTPYGQWRAMAKPYFKGFSRVKKAAALQEMVNAGKIGSALAKARNYMESEDAGLSNEGTYIKDTCVVWINKIQAIEESAVKAGDVYAAYMIADELCDLLKGCDEGDAAKDRCKTYKDHEQYDVGKKFYQTWQKTWGQDRAKSQALMQSFKKKNPDNYYAQLIDQWYP